MTKCPCVEFLHHESCSHSGCYEAGRQEGREEVEKAVENFNVGRLPAFPKEGIVWRVANVLREAARQAAHPNQK